MTSGRASESATITGTTSKGTKPSEDGPGGLPGGGAELLARPAVVIAAVAAIALAMGWQFLTDASRSVPAFDAAWYQWRAEFLQANDPAALITLRGAEDALAGGYRVAEPVLAALMRTVGGVAAGTPTVFLSVLFRVLAAVGIAAFSWQHRRDPLLLVLTLLTAPALFLLQRFFGFLDNFFALALMAGVLLLMKPMRTSWVARLAAINLMLLGGLTHPTTLALFLLSVGAVAGYRVLRERSFRPTLALEGPVLLCGAVAVGLTLAVWNVGLWGPTAAIGEAAVPPPQPASYFIQRSLSVMSNMTPVILVPLLALGAGHLIGLRTKEWFGELTLGWTLPLVGMFGFVLGAAYPYFRFFNSTLAPVLLCALGMVVLLRAPRRITTTGRNLGAILTVVVAVGLIAVLATWWARGLSMWHSSGSWLTPDVRVSMAAAKAYLAAEPPGRRAVFVLDAQPDPAIVPYGEYKEYANSVYAGLDGDQIDRASIFFGRIEDLERGEATSLGDAQYDRLSAETDEALQAVDRDPGNVVVFVPMVFNAYSSNGAFVEACPRSRCVPLADSGVYVLPAVAGTPASERAVAAAAGSVREAQSFLEQPPGPLAGIGATALAALRLAILMIVPGWLLFRRLPGPSWVEGLALVPLLSIGLVTTVGILLVAVLRGPLTPAAGWIACGLALAVGVGAEVWGRARTRVRS